jgi:hypothetical protein
MLIKSGPHPVMPDEPASSDGRSTQLEKQHFIGHQQKPRENEVFFLINGGNIFLLVTCIVLC